MKGWFKDSWRHMLSAKGIKTRKYQNKKEDLFEEIRVRNTVALRRRRDEFDKDLQDFGVSDDHISEIPDNIKNRLVLGIPLGEHEMRFVPRKMREEAFDIKAKEIQDEIKSDEKYVKQQEDHLVELESSMKKAMLKKDFKLSDEYRQYMSDSEVRMKDALESVKQSKEKLPKLKKELLLDDNDEPSGDKWINPKKRSQWGI